VEIESGRAILILDVLVIQRETTLATKVYSKPTHTGQYLSFNSNHPPHVERGLSQSHHKQLLPYAKNDRIYIMKLAASDGIFS
jgi:hypothetical protein